MSTSDAQELEAGRTPAGLLSRFLALLAIAPAILHLIGRGGAGWTFVLAGLALPCLIGMRSAGSESRRSGRVLAFAIGAGLVVPMLPTVIGLFGFALERVFFGGALFWLLWRGRLKPRSSGSGRVLLLRSVVIAWAAWSTGAALRALWISFPEGAPWIADSFRAALLDPLGSRSMVDPTYPMIRLWQRLEMLLLIWAALEVALADRGFAKRLATSLAVALPCGIAVNAIAIVVGFKGSGHPFAIRMSSVLDRVFRPLPDHNALGSALVLAIPAVVWLAWSAGKVPSEERDPRARTLARVALACGLLLLIGASSKSGLLGLFVAGGAGICLWLAHHRGRARRLLFVLLGVGVLIPVGVQLLPRATVVDLLQVRYVREVIRVARFDQVGRYLQDNRYALWNSATAMIGEAPLTGIGLGRFPRVLPDHHDPDAPGFFNPLQENAHNQYLQWAAEEGLVGAALGGSIFLLALLAGLAVMRSRADSATTSERLGLCALTAALFGLTVNLLVGHALLVPAVAGLFAAIVGLVVAGAAQVLTAVEPPRTWPRFAAGWLLFIPISAAPAALEERTPLADFQVDCFPWLWQPGVREVPTISRMLGPDARWIERWGDGSRMILLVKSIVAPIFGGEDQYLDVYLNDKLVVEHFRLPRKQPQEPLNPVVVLKLDAPSGVTSGDLVHLRVVCSYPYAESIGGAHSQSMWGPRVWPPTFKTPR